MNADVLKVAAATAALEWVKSDCVLGVGTGSTTECFIRLLPEHPAKPKLVVSSSAHSTVLLQECGVQVVDLTEAGNLDVYVDGADEFTERFTLVKGGGGAHTREKILAAAARQFVVIVDSSKEVSVLGRFPVPVEVLPMARSLVARKVVGLGGNPALREGFTTDEGNVILDCTGFDCKDSAKLEAQLCALPGVVDCGLCAMRPADTILVGESTGVRRLQRQ